MIDIYKIIACPICKNQLQPKENCLECAQRGTFAVTEKGVPILFSEKNTQTFEDGEKFYADEKRNSRIVFLKRKLFRKPKLYFGVSLHDKLKKQYIINAPKDDIILNIGSGHENIHKQENMVNFDIYPHGNTHVAGDAHNLPFLDNAVDIVWLCAVLEHINQPFTVVEEVYRVLKPGGYILISVPFLQYLHASPHDYFRYTKFGLRSICSNFTEVEAGASYTGPMGTLIQLASVLPEAAIKNKILKNGLSVAISWILLPLILFDPLFKEQEILAGGICYLGIKE